MSSSTRQWAKVRRNILNFLRFRLRVTFTWKLVGIVAVTMVVVVLIWGVLQSGFFRIKHLTYVRTDVPTYVDITRINAIMLDTVRKQNIFGIEIASLGQEVVQSEPFIKKATITKQLPDTLLITLQWNEPAVAVYYDDYCQILGRDGKKLRQLTVDECGAFAIPKVTSRDKDQIYYSSIYIDYITRFSEYLRLNNQPAPTEFTFSNAPQIEIIARFKDHSVRLAVDQDVLYNYLVYSSVKQSIRNSLLRGKTLDLTTKEPFLY